MSSGLKFLENRDNPEAFEPVPGATAPSVGAPPLAADTAAGIEAYRVTVNGRSYDVQVEAGGAVADIKPAPVSETSATPAEDHAVPAPLAGNIYKLSISPGQVVEAGEVIMILEAMKMETEVRAPVGGQVSQICVKEGDAVQVGETLVMLS